MRFTVTVLGRARGDLAEIYFWLSKRSVEGAERWYEAFLEALERLRKDADIYAAAAKSPKSSD